MAPVFPSPARCRSRRSTGTVPLAAGETRTVEIDGTAAGTEYDQIAVTGSVDVTGATLATTFGFTSVAGDSFVLIANDGADAVVGTFDGLGEGATFLSGGRTYHISYAGNDGNDVTLTDYVEPPPSGGGGDGSATISGSAGPDLLTGTAGNDVIDGGAGADTVLGGGGGDSVLGGSGADVVYGNQGTDIRLGPGDPDILFARPDRDAASGHQGGPCPQALNSRGTGSTGLHMAKHH